MNKNANNYFSIYILVDSWSAVTEGRFTYYLLLIVYYIAQLIEKYMCKIYKEKDLKSDM